MRPVYATPGGKIYAGRQGENNATEVCFDVFPFYDVFGNTGSFSIKVLRYGETDAYTVLAANVTVSNGYVHWTVSSADTSIAGDNECQVIYTIGTNIMKSVRYKYVVGNSIE
jgi:hypothetical protein